MDVKRFFEVVLPHLVLRAFDDFIQQEGTLAFDVRGVGQWSFTFGSEEPVTTGLKEGAGLTLSFTPPAFEGFIDGSLDLMAAVARRDITAKGGKLHLLEAFSRVLKPPASDLGWEANTVG